MDGRRLLVLSYISAGPMAGPLPTLQPTQPQLPEMFSQPRWGWHSDRHRENVINSGEDWPGDQPILVKADQVTNHGQPTGQAIQASSSRPNLPIRWTREKVQNWLDCRWDRFTPFTWHQCIPSDKLQYNSDGILPPDNIDIFAGDIDGFHQENYNVVQNHICFDRFLPYENVIWYVGKISQANPLVL